MQPRLAWSSLLAEDDLELPNAPASTSQVLKSQSYASASGIKEVWVCISLATEEGKHKIQF